MANKKKKSKEPNPKILNKQDRIKSTKKLDQLDQGTAYIPNEAIINVPISGSFRYAIEEALHYIMSSMTSDEIIIVMYSIKTNFQKTKDGEVTNRDRAIWTLMSLLSEINYQAADQNLTRYTDKPINEDLAGIINKMHKENPEDIDSIQEFGKYNEKYNEFDKKRNSTEG